MPTLKTPKDKRNNAERYKPKKKAGSGRTISDKDKAIIGRAKGRTISDKDIALIANAFRESISSESLSAIMGKAMSDRPKTNKSPVKSRMMNKDGSDPLMKKKAYGGMAKKKKMMGGGMMKKKMMGGGMAKKKK